MSQSQLATAVHVTQGYVSHVEIGRRPPSEQFTRACDDVLQAGGTLINLWPETRRGAHPPWFAEWAAIERQATVLRSYEMMVVPGLLQTEAYAGELIRTGQFGISRQRVEELVGARMERQSILDAEEGPKLWAVLDAFVLKRGIGGAKIMRGQLQKLLDACEHPRINIQVIPEETASHAGLSGAFTIATHLEDIDVAYVETAADGQVIHSPRSVAQLTTVFDALCAEGLSLRRSADYLSRMEKSWN